MRWIAWPRRGKRVHRKKRPRRSRPPLLERARRPLLVLGVLVAAGTLGWAIRAAVLAPALAVRRVAVSGTERLPRERALAVLAEHVGEPIALVDLDAIRAALESEPIVARAMVARRLPDLLEARIDERVPVARARLAGGTVLVDENGVLFPPGLGSPGDEKLPELRGLATRPGEPALVAADRPALAALEALRRVTGHAPPPGTFVDLAPRRRIVLRPGRNAPLLWLDRDDPGRNLEDLFAWKDRLVALREGAAIDLRFTNRLIVVPGSPGSLER